MKTLASVAIFIVGVAVLSPVATAQKTTIEGQLLNEKRQPLQGAEIRMQSYDASIGGFGLRTDSDGHFAAKSLPPSDYRVTIRVNGDDVFVANNIRTRVGDPWRINYDMKHALVTMSTEHSKKIRRFAWQSQRTGTQISGRWVETTASNGYEPEAQRVESSTSMETLREMAKSHPGVVPPGR